MRNNGGVYRLDADTGKAKWKNQIGKLSASSPAYWKDRLFVTSLSGKLTVLDARATASSSGRSSSAAARSRRRSSAAASSTSAPRAATCTRCRRKTGRVKWKYSASGAIKASPALSGSTLYVGDYSGRMYAVWARTGRERWSTGTSGTKFGFAAGNFYSTPAVAFGRVYAGNTDGKVYSFGARNGTLAWSQVDRRLRLLLPRGGERAGHEADRLHRLLRRQPVRARRAHGRRRAGPHAAAAGSRAGRRSSGGSSTSPTSTPSRPTAWMRAPASASSSAAAAPTTRWSRTAAAST